MEKTKVLYLKDDGSCQEMYYNLPVLSALKSAYLQIKGNHNTWTYEQINLKYIETTNGFLIDITNNSMVWARKN